MTTATTTLPATAVPVAESRFAADDRLIRWQLYLGFFAVFIGMVMGLLQSLDRVGIDLYGSFGLASYYQGLTLHGVLNVLVFTFAFNAGFLSYVTSRSLARPLNHRLTQLQFWLMVVGVFLAGWKMLDNSSTVLFTFYPPLRGHPLFYLGLVFVVLSSWATLANLALTCRAWQRDHPGEPLPLQAFISLITYVMWGLASIGIAVEVLALVLPWSMGLIDKIDPQLTRALFWYSGHAIVYFWLMPIYVSWYTMLPRQVGGKLFSDPLTRIVFLAFLVLSVPTGFHHQFSDPGIPTAWKWIHGVTTFGIWFPSAVTAFSVLAALEVGGRARGGKGFFGWMWALPWDNPSVLAQLLAGLVFMLGGITGLVMGSYTLNVIVHNTSFIPGHFHLTIGTGVMLSAMGVAYWLFPALTGRKLAGRGMALASSWFWTIGVLTFSSGQTAAGLSSMPRRTWVSGMSYFVESWHLDNVLTAIGGTIMFMGAMLFFVVITLTLMNKERAVVVMPVTEVYAKATEGPRFIHNIRLWILVAVAMILFSYGPYFIGYLFDPNFVSPPFRLW